MALARAQEGVVRVAGGLSLLRSPEQRPLPLYGSISGWLGLSGGRLAVERSGKCRGPPPRPPHEVVSNVQMNVAGPEEPDSLTVVPSRGFQRPGYATGLL